MKLPPKKTWLWIGGGAAVGLAYYFLVGCPTGGCPLTSNPYTSTLWGAVTGALLGWPPKARSARAKAKAGQAEAG